MVILGQDPYHGPNQAHGLAFSVKKNVPKPPSLKNIFKEISEDLKIEKRSSGDLTNWAKQGVLLLNTCLTVSPGRPGSHSHLGWQEFTDSVIKAVDTKDRVVFILWGSYARKKKELLSNNKNLILSYLRHPLMTFKIIAAIHFEAFKLWIKGIKFVKKKLNIKNNISIEN